MAKKIQAWIVVNKDFEKLLNINKSLVSGDMYFTEHQAQNHIDALMHKFCKECGSKKKPRELHLKIVPIEFNLNNK